MEALKRYQSYDVCEGYQICEDALVFFWNDRMTWGTYTGLTSAPFTNVVTRWDGNVDSLGLRPYAPHPVDLYIAIMTFLEMQLMIKYLYYDHIVFRLGYCLLAVVHRCATSSSRHLQTDFGSFLGFKQWRVQRNKNATSSWLWHEPEH